MTATPDPQSPSPDPGAGPHLAVLGLNLSRAGRILLDGVSLSVAVGEAVAVLGPPGAGKAALVDWLAGLCRADRGSLHFAGALLGRRERATRAQFGLVLPIPSFAAESSCLGNLTTAAKLMVVPAREAQARARDLLRYFELEEYAGDAAGDIPAAVTRRLELARALIHDPSLLLLGEPFRDLDRQSAMQIWRRLSVLKDSRNLSVLICTTRPEIARDCDRVLLLDRGRVIADDTPAGLLDRVAREFIVVEGVEAVELEMIAEEISQAFTLTPRMERECGRVLFPTDDGQPLLNPMLEALGTRPGLHIALRPAELTDVFAEVTGRGFGEVR